MRQRYETAVTFDNFLAGVQRNADLWRAVHRRAQIPERFVARVTALGKRFHLLVLSEDWCGDAVNTVPVVARLVERCASLDLRLLARDANPDIMDAHLTGSSRSIPVVIVLDEAYRECGWWGPRPRELQRWVLSAGMALETTDRYREIRRWYARDGGVSTLEEIVSMLERCAATRAAEEDLQAQDGSAAGRHPS